MKGLRGPGHLCACNREQGKDGATRYVSRVAPFLGGFVLDCVPLLKPTQCPAGSGPKIGSGSDGIRLGSQHGLGSDPSLPLHPHCTPQGPSPAKKSNCFLPRAAKKRAQSRHPASPAPSDSNRRAISSALSGLLKIPLDVTGSCTLRRASAQSGRQPPVPAARASLCWAQVS